MWPRDAYVGQHVVCITDEHWKFAPHPAMPKLGNVYTVAKVVCDDAYCVFLTFSNANDEWQYSARNFKPVDPKRIEVFKAMLNPVPVDA